MRKAINITYYECVFVALNIQHATRIACEETDEQTDMTNLIVAFRKFVKAPNNATRFRALMQDTLAVPIFTANGDVRSGMLYCHSVYLQCGGRA